MDYYEYINSTNWKELTDKLIHRNKRAYCAICNKRTHLLLHHKHYRNIGNERLGRDLVILCFDCHRHVHYYLYPFIKVPLQYVLLEKRRYFLTVINRMQKFDIVGCINAGYQLAILK